MRISVEDQNPTRKTDLNEIKRVADKAVRSVFGKASFELNIVLVTDARIKAMNRKYLNENRVTDVLAFPGPGSDGRSGMFGSDRAKFLGDIAISSDRAARNAVLYGVPFNEEVARYVVHGVLHLAGYDDASRSGKEKMTEKEDDILEEAFKKKQK